MKKSMFMKIYIIPMIFLSPILMTSCNSWFSIWMIMEINLMSFIPLIIFFNKFYKELSIKYFIIQAISSSTLIMSSNLMLFNMNNIKLIIILLINLSLFMKIGSPPFHNWFINMMNNMNWMNCLILSTWQKIIPFISIMYIYNKYLIYMMTLMSSIIGTIFSLNHQSLRIIISYSSINHLSWMFMNLMISETIWMFYFISYSIINFTIMLMFNKMNIFFINQMFMFNSIHNLKYFIIFNFFSISSLPPMFGFSMKWISIYYININMIQIMLIFITMMSIISFFYYIRICINFMLNFNMTNKINLMNKFINFNSFKYSLLISSFINLWIMTMWMF